MGSTTSPAESVMLVKLSRRQVSSADTESVLLELGLDWDDLIRYKDLGAIT